MGGVVVRGGGVEGLGADISMLDRFQEFQFLTKPLLPAAAPPTGRAPCPL